MKKAMLALLLLSCGTMSAETHFSVGIGIGGYGPAYGRVPPPPPEYDRPPCPGDGYDWVDGYWYPSGPRFYWRSGYWRAPAYYGYRGARGYDRGFGWREREYDHRRYEHYDRGRSERNEFRREERHEDRRGRHDEDRWRR